MKIQTLLVALLFIVSINSVFAGKRLQLAIIFEKDTVDHFENIEYQVQWTNPSNDTVEILDTWEYFKRPKLEAKIIEEDSWHELWKSEDDLDEICYLKRVIWDARPKYLVIPPRSAVTIYASYFPIWEEVTYRVLLPNNSYEFRPLLPSGLEKIRIKVVSDRLFIKRSTEDNELLFNEIVMSGMNAYDLFKSWSKCVNDSITVQKFVRLAQNYPQSNLSKLIRVKETNWKLSYFEREKYAGEFEKEALHRDLTSLRQLAHEEFYDLAEISEMMVTNLENGLGWCYDLEVYFDNLAFAEDLREK